MPKTFLIEFDKNKLPYLGLWIDYGLVNGSHYIGLEPCSLGYDTVANAAHYHGNNKIENSLMFDITLSVLLKI